MLATRSLFLLITIFIVTQSQAIINDSALESNTASFTCRSFQDTQFIHVYLNHKDQGLPCQVTLETKHQTIQLLEARRSVKICETKAQTMAQRLEDRGWQCQN
jgi:uncharacterized lipoprotein YajG